MTFFKGKKPSTGMADSNRLGITEEDEPFSSFKDTNSQHKGALDKDEKIMFQRS